MLNFYLLGYPLSLFINHNIKIPLQILCLSCSSSLLVSFFLQLAIIFNRPLQYFTLRISVLKTVLYCTELYTQQGCRRFFKHVRHVQIDFEWPRKKSIWNHRTSSSQTLFKKIFFFTTDQNTKNFHYLATVYSVLHIKNRQANNFLL